MKIKDLDQHCGNCSIIEYCGNPFGFCICRHKRFSDMDENEYKSIAENVTDIKRLDACEDCYEYDCGVHSYSDTDFADEDCEYRDLARDYYCEQIADRVVRAMKKR